MEKSSAYNGLAKRTKVAELKEAGLLKGARAMANRVYGSAAWYVEWDGADIDALYKPRRETRFVVARRRSGGRTRRGRARNDASYARGHGAVRWFARRRSPGEL